MATPRIRPTVLLKKLAEPARAALGAAVQRERSRLLSSPLAPVVDRARDTFEIIRTRVLSRPDAGGRTATEALAEADAILRGEPKDRPTEQGGTVTGDPDHVNNASDVNPGSKRFEAAQAQVEANAELEARYVARMSEADQARYAAVREGLAADPVAQLALQTMLFRGQLPGEKDLTGEANLLGHLHGLATDRLAVGIPREALLADVVQEVATPSSMAQRGKGTCAATAVEIHLLHTNPAEYVRLVAGLASPSGRVQLASGQELRRELGTRRDDSSGRSHSQRLMAPAMMEVANGEWDYDNQRDVHAEDGEDKGRGLTARQVDVLLEAVYGRDFAFGSNLDSEQEKEAAFDLIEDVTRGGEPVLVGLTWGTGGHKVVVTGTGVENGEAYVTFINPWGREERMPKDAFLERLRNVNYDPNA